MTEMNAIEELAQVIERARRGEDLARRRSPQPSMLVEYYRQRDEQMVRVQQHLAETRQKERE
jgi:hypothetical protein